MKFAISTILASAFLLQDVAGRAIEERAIEERTTATPVKNTGKRGLSYNNAAYTTPFSLSGQNSQVSWAYNWYQVAGSGFNSALEYVPMLWSNASDLTSSWTANAQAAINAGSTHLLGFNEPDLCLAGAGSSCIEMQSAVKAWKQYMEPFAGKALLGSPAVTNGGSPMGLTWLSNFMGNCTGCHIDFINIHWYSNKYAGANYFKQQVEAAHAMSGGRPVWITEFGLDSSVSYTQDELTSFLEEVIDWMDSTDYVQRYAYFMDTTGALMNSDGSGMSDLGSMYNSYPEVSSASSSASPSSTTAVLSTSSSAMTAVPSTVLSSSSAIVTTSSTYTSSRTTSAPISSLTSSSSKTSAASSVQTSSSSTKSVLSSTTASSKAAASTASGISILGAYFADKDVTTAAQTAFIQNGNLVVNTYTLASALSVSDPWYGVVKTISILYSDASNNAYIFSSAEQTGTYTINPSSIPSSAKTPSIAPVDGSTIEIVGMVWGTQQIKTSSVWDRIYYQQATGWGFQINTNLFGVDGFWGHAKVGIVWYRDAQGVLKSLVSRENAWVKF
ncbi:glycoside hydrolase family 128 protein, partial [Aureobasidium melanogenum]